MRLLPLMMILTACAAPNAGGPTRDQEGLSRELAGRTEGPPQQCISSTPSNAALNVVDERTLTFRQGRTLWVNRLEAGCPGMRPLDTLIVEIHGNQYCRNDRFRTRQAGTSIPGPTCLLGDFVPYRRR